MVIMNETMENKSFRNDSDTPLIFAGHLLLVFYCLIFIFGFLGNAAVIYVGIRKKKYRNVTNCYVINLALADLLFLTLSIPYTTYVGLVNTDPFGDRFCKIYMYLAYVFLLATCNTLAAMSIDRYFYIVLPKSKLQWRTPQNAFIICILIWTGSLALIIPYHRITTNLKNCGADDGKSFLVCFFVFCSYYAIPLVIIIVCYTKLALHVIRSNRLIVSQMNTKDIPKSLRMKRRRVTRMVIIVTLAFAICWLPIHILELMKCAHSSILYKLILSYPKILYTVRAFTHALAYFNSCLNPYLYALLNRNFCFDLIDIIPQCFKCWRQAHLLQTTTSHRNTKILLTPILSNENLFIQGLKNDEEEEEDDDDDDDFESSDQEKIKTTSLDIACQVELSHICNIK